jgi:cytochrome b pre-mRNA-processing protein 3
LGKSKAMIGLATWRAKRAAKERAAQWAEEITRAARREVLFAEFGVADTLDGRFEMVALHAGLTMRRLMRLGEQGREAAQRLADAIFEGFDDAFRALSIADAGVIKRQKTFGAAFYGRLTAYEAALEARDRDALRGAQARNFYGAANPADARHAGALADYALRAALGLDAVDLAAFVDGVFKFPVATPLEKVP